MKRKEIEKKYKPSLNHCRFLFYPLAAGGNRQKHYWHTEDYG
jgi:hypothetical protein